MLVSPAPPLRMLVSYLLQPLLQGFVLLFGFVQGCANGFFVLFFDEISVSIGEHVVRCRRTHGASIGFGARESAVVLVSIEVNHGNYKGEK